MAGANEKKILIVDDEASIRTLLRSAVGGPGFSVFEADCGEVALQIAEGYGPFALVMSDIVMPGMDGFELARNLIQKGAAQAFLLMSGYADMDDMAKRMEGIPVARFLSKPFLIGDLLRVTRELLTSESPVARAAAVRDRRGTALRTPAHPLARLRRLMRKSQRLQEQSHRLLADVDTGNRLRVFLQAQAISKVQAIASVERRLAVPRAMVEGCCCGTPSSSRLY